MLNRTRDSRSREYGVLTARRRTRVHSFGILDERTRDLRLTVDARIEVRCQDSGGDSSGPLRPPVTARHRCSRDRYGDGSRTRRRPRRSPPSRRTCTQTRVPGRLPSSLARRSSASNRAIAAPELHWISFLHDQSGDAVLDESVRRSAHRVRRDHREAGMHRLVDDEPQLRGPSASSPTAHEPAERARSCQEDRAAETSPTTLMRGSEASPPHVGVPDSLPPDRQSRARVGRSAKAAMRSSMPFSASRRPTNSSSRDSATLL